MNTRYKFLTLFLAVVMLAFTAGAEETGDTQEFEVNGLKVILKHSPKEVISARFFVKGGTANYPINKAGVEAMAFELAMSGGTKSMDKTTFNAAAEGIGASFSGNSTYDYGTMNMTCIGMFWDKSWDLYVDAIMNPAFDAKEFKLLQEQLVTAAKSNESDPDTYLRELAMSYAFKGSDNEKNPDGTAQSLASITLEDVKSHYKKVLGKGRSFLVVVGDISKEDLENKIKNSLAKLPAGTPAPKSKRVLINEGGEMVVDRDIATNYIRGVMSAPLMTEADGMPMRLGMSILYDRYFLELRTNRSLSYAPAAFYSTGVLQNPYNVIYISTQKPKESMEVMVDIINSIKKDGFLQSELDNKKQTYITQYFMGLETSSSQSQTLGIYEILGDWRLADEFTDSVNEVVLKDLNRVFDKYTKAIKWVYLGNEEQVMKGDFKQVKESPNKPY